MVQLQERKLESRKAFSRLQKERIASRCIKPKVILHGSVHVMEKEALGAANDHEQIKALFPNTYGKPRVELVAGEASDVVATPLRLGVVLSGGQAPGGHNVIAGIYDYAMKCHPDSEVFGFLDGPHGVMNGIYAKIEPEVMDSFRNTGGFDMLGSGRHKIETQAQMEDSMDVCSQLKLNGLVVIGGDDSNTNAAILAEFFASRGSSTRVGGCPKTIDGDLKNQYVPISFGFDTAAKTFSEEIGNVGLDALSSQKYYHFIRLMGRAASNIALECALQTRPNLTLISEEVEAKEMSLKQITAQIVDMVLGRAAAGKNYGVVMLPEGLIEFIPEFNALISDINEVLASGISPTEEAVLPALKRANREVFEFLPRAIKMQLLLDRDPHGNVQVAKIETERLLAQTVAGELDRLRGLGSYSAKFAPQFHSFGYEGRCAMPSHFDCSYCYSLGYTQGALISKGLNGLMASVNALHLPIEDWVIGGVPITMMCHMERRKGKDKPVIKKALVELDGAPFKAFAAQREKWAVHDLYRAPGPIQFYSEGARDINFTLTYELLGAKGDELTKCNLDPASTPAPVPMGSTKFMYRPQTAELRSHVEQTRLVYEPKLPRALQAKALSGISMIEDEPTQSRQPADHAPLRRMFPSTYGTPLIEMDVDYTVFDTTKPAPAPMKVGVVFCGRPAAGGHNIIWGLHDFLKTARSTLVGFIGGTLGLFDQQCVEITDELLEGYKNQGGFDLLGRTVDSIRSDACMQKARQACETLKLDGLVLIGGTRTHTDAAYLAEMFKAEGLSTTVVGVPCSISGGMKNHFVESAVGFDTAVKLYSQLAGNTAIDGASARKYWYFMRLMGQDPSHMVVESALQSHPNMVILAEEVAAKRWSLQDIVREVADVVQARATEGKNFGTVLLPEGLIQAIPEMDVLIQEIDDIYEATPGQAQLSIEEVQSRLTPWSAALLKSTPAFLQRQVCLERQSNHKVQLGQIETEKLLVFFVEEELKKRKEAGTYTGNFSAVCSYLGYQARAALPSNFDCDYAYSLGGVAAALLGGGRTGYMASITGLKGPVKDWKVGGVPLSSMLVCDDMERLPSGKIRPRIPPTPIDLYGPAIHKLREQMKKCEIDDCYQNFGPLQFAGESAESRLKVLDLETVDYLESLAALREALVKIKDTCRPGCDYEVLHAFTSVLTTVGGLLPKHMK